jgi:HK97 family phage major capsid protein
MSGSEIRRFSDSELREQIRALTNGAAGRDFTSGERAQWNDLNEQLEERDVRRRRLVELSRSEHHTEREMPSFTATSYRSTVEPHMERLRSEVMQTLDRNVESFEAEAQRKIERFVENDITGVAQGMNSRYIKAVGHEAYRSAFGKMLLEPQSAHLRWTPDEHEAMAGVNREMEFQRALGISGTGNYGVPLQLDPTIVLTSSGALNPIRQIARVEQTAVNQVNMVTSTGVTAAFAAEATEASDNSPTLVQPIAYVEKAFAFIPFSIEVGEDWQGLTGELSRLLVDAKDVLEAQKFVTGLGHTSHEPQGLIAAGGATAIITSGSTAAIHVADIYSTIETLGYRFRPNARIAANPTIWDSVYKLVAGRCNERGDHARRAWWSAPRNPEGRSVRLVDRTHER